MNDSTTQDPPDRPDTSFVPQLDARQRAMLAEMGGGSFLNLEVYKKKKRVFFFIVSVKNGREAGRGRGEVSGGGGV
ncbi:hypothetical protein F3K02_21245 [Hydrogenophaga sp. D2P1]|uniref:Uncharacterized protein n=1 Tax=Hydrogenophaga aromaticivorans TaxID=2610898 RepID=A0A7Y8L019_9BURK|nr:hypothetical protein [Hydrogenophaga aromaticivorans]NWF47758.1 hypothetical protein [Hydrogenophaga aromaticivorans]